MSTTATALLGGVVGLVAGVSLMTVRELGRQQKQRRKDDDHPSREE